MRAATFFAAALVTGAASAADQPLSLVHEGRLLNGSDAAVEDPALAMKFEIFAEKFADSGQSPLWTGSCSVAVVHGLYAVTLGADCGTNLTSQALPYGQARWLQVTVGGVAMQPRLRLGAVPAAAVAGDALTVGGLHPSELWTKAEAVDAATFGGKLPADYWKKADAVNAAAFGGKAPSDYWMKADAVDAATLGGRSLTDLDGRYVKAQGGGSVTISGALQATTISGDGRSLTNLDAGALAAGTLPDARLSGTYSGAIQFTNSANQFTGTFTGTFKGDGTQLSLDAGKLGSGTVPDARLPTNLARTDGANAFTQPQSFGAVSAGSIVSSAGIKLGNDGSTCGAGNAGTLRWTGTALELCVANAWTPIALGKMGTVTNPGRSCKAILDGGGSVGDGTYWIDPDGAGGVAPMQVACDMTSYGGGWTRCLSIHYWGSSKPQSWVKGTWLGSQWQTGSSSVYDTAISGTNFGNFCTLLASFSTQVFGEATYATTTPKVKTEALSLPAGFFATGSQARTTGSGNNAIAVDSANQGRYGAACTNVYTSNTTQGIQSICINDASHQQTMHTGWVSGQYSACPDSSAQPCFCTQDNYCGGNDPNEQKITMVLYLR